MSPQRTERGLLTAARAARVSITHTSNVPEKNNLTDANSPSLQKSRFEDESSQASDSITSHPIISVCVCHATRHVNESNRHWSTLVSCIVISHQCEHMPWLPGPPSVASNRLWSDRLVRPAESADYHERVQP